MNRQTPTTWGSVRADWQQRTCCAAMAGFLFCVSSIFAQPAEPPQDHDPLFQPVELYPSAFAALTIGSGANPSVGAFQCYDMLLAGEHPWISAWAFYQNRLSLRENSSVAAASLAALGTGSTARPLSELALIAGGQKAGFWRLHDPDHVQAIAPYHLQAIRDGRLITSRMGNGLAYDALLQTILQASETNASAFAGAARRDVTFSHLFHDPAEYRGDVVRIEGRLRLVQRERAPADLQIMGIPWLYFAWVFDDLSGGNPYCIVFTEMPANLPVHQKINQFVTFDGYYFMNRHYKAEDSKKPNEARVAPLLIGRTLVVPPAPAAPTTTGSEWPKGMLVSFLAVAAGVMVLVGALAYWFRWQDARVHRRLRAARQFVEPLATEDAPPAWALGADTETPMQPPSY